MTNTSTIDSARLLHQLAEELAIRPAQASAAVDLLDDGATVPFIARYRKEATGGLDDAVLRDLEVRLLYLRDLESRRLAILESIQSQDKLTPELQAEILEANTKQRLEDLYAPYKPKRRTRAQIALEAGLDALVSAILDDSQCDPLLLAEQYVNADAGFDDAKKALDGAREILAQRFAENADVLENLRSYLWQHGLLYASVMEGKELEGDKFRDWFDFSERLQTLPSHRVLALLRGRQQGILSLRLGLSPEMEALQPHPCIERLVKLVAIPADFSPEASPQRKWLAEVSRIAWRVKLLTAFETELIGRLREEAEAEATRVFAANLRDLLLSAPAGNKRVLGLDPGIRTGVKVAAIDETGKVIATDTVYPFGGRKDVHGTQHTLAHLIRQHQLELIAIGNGTASRETEQLVKELLASQSDLSKVQHIVVSEAGASVYSASELASQEFPELDVSLRGAVSIARRLQDPLAELVKIDPKAIGVGQYQHDVNQRELERSLDAVVEDCVNAVGVDVNTASSALLARVSGLNKTLAENIVEWRDEFGAFPDRHTLLKVKRFGPKTFEQAAGFLRVLNGANPLDASAVHPEAYPIAQQILQKAAASAAEVIGKADALKGLSPKDFINEQFGLPTVQDIFTELERPGRDPRPEFKTVQFLEGVTEIKDLRVGMVLEGVVSNVANFGAFVDIGVHQDGLVHISALANKFVSDPREVVRVGQTVQVKVLEVDEARKRISLTMRLDDEATPTRKNTSSSTKASRPQRPERTERKAPDAANNAMAAAFAKLKR
ncbi:Tex family protein [Paenalcaligenes hominis]|uniref:Tex family protein n=1 Tax=Paenalcaligenes hominis TaxID=643674 RepID=UPI0035248F36